MAMGPGGEFRYSRPSSGGKHLRIVAVNIKGAPARVCTAILGAFVAHSTDRNFAAKRLKRLATAKHSLTKGEYLPRAERRSTEFLGAFTGILTRLLQPRLSRFH